MKKAFSFSKFTCAAFSSMLLLVSCGPINSNYDPHFGVGDEDGYLINDTDRSQFQILKPSELKFYVEVSGSMNGFFRANKPTYFKSDIWNILSYYQTIAPKISVLTNDGTQGAVYQHGEFQYRMNTGSFVSTASTKVPLMLKTIINDLDIEKGEVAILISDMKYSPVGSAAPQVLMTQYSTDVSRILGEFGYAVSLIGATSNFLDRRGREVCLQSPYYYLILGKPEYVAGVRNEISTLLEKQGHFIDNIETGFDYGSPKYSFGIPNRCIQLEEEPVFTNYEEEEDGDTCIVKLKLDLGKYRWLMGNERNLMSCFKASPKYGSELKVDNFKIDVQNITDDNKQLIRKVTASISLKVYNMATESEVIEWTLEIPNSDYSKFLPFFENAVDENDPCTSFSVEDFVKGMFDGVLMNKPIEPNYILVSKNN